jgi:Methyltransferase domain
MIGGVKTPNPQSAMQRLLLCALVLLIDPAYSSLPSEDYRQMDEIALRTGADKGSHFHNYTEIYSKYFAPLKSKPIKFLEIGIHRGASVQLWEEYFQSAELHFIDITLERLEYTAKRSHYHLCDQENPTALNHFIEKTGGNFDVILDDGGHTMKQQINSFITLFPHIKSGGMYIIEDLHTSYWSHWPGRFEADDARSTVEFLKALIDDVNHVDAITERASHLAIPPEVLEKLNLYQREIFSIHFYDSVAIILKR